MTSRTVTFQLDNNNNMRSSRVRNHPSSFIAPLEVSSPPTRSSLSSSSSSGPITFSPTTTQEASKRRLSPEASWRKYGKVYRAQIVMQDEQKGGKSYLINDQCSIDRYYRVAEKVLDQFLSKSSVSSNPQEVSEAYLVGKRLVKFLSVVLPTHSEYASGSPVLVEKRIRSQEQLIDLLQFMEELALIVDEIQYNLYILQDLTPKSSSGDWTESTANETSLSSSYSTENSFEQRVAAVVSAAEQDQSKPAKQQHPQSTVSKKLSEEEDFFADFDTQTADFSFPASFADFDSPTDDWFSELEKETKDDWFLDEALFESPQREAQQTFRSAQRTSTRIPNLKPPRSAPPRYTAQKPQFPVDFDEPSVALSVEHSLNRSHSLLDKDEAPLSKTKIEERWERSQEELAYLETRNEEQDSLNRNSNKRILRHFQGCKKLFL